MEDGTVAKDNITEIIELCQTLDRLAFYTYEKFSNAAEEAGARSFWRSMASEERFHVKFWLELQNVAKKNQLPHVFDSPAEVLLDLKKSTVKIKKLFKNLENSKRKGDAYMLAWRLEFVMLHPAFLMLFNAVKSLPLKSNPGPSYKMHINRFISGFNRYGRVTPELELLGETLQFLWDENNTLSDLATKDGLTGLLNRRSFTGIARQFLYLGERNRSNAGIFMIDIDNFKMVNDRHGHAAGDEVLKKVASVIQGSCRKSDLAARFGGEEFVIFFPDVQPAALLKIGEKLRAAVEKTSASGISVTVSIGAAQEKLSKVSDQTLVELIKKADENLYAAKKAGKNRVVA